MTQVVLGIDCSTTAVKCIAWDAEGRERAIGRAPLALSIPAPGLGEQDPVDWWTATSAAIRACVKELGEGSVEVRAITVTHQRETFACVDRDGEAVRPAMLWMDARATVEVERFGTTRVLEITGKPANTTPAFYKLLWLLAHEPETLARTALVVDVHAYLVHRLTDLWVTSVASADSLGFIDIATGEYCEELLAQTGLGIDAMPSLVPPGTVIALVRDDVADLLGLPRGVAVIAGAGDGQSAGLGAGIIAPGRAYLNVGTGLISGSYSDDYRPRSAYRAMAGTVPGSVNYELFVGAGTLMVTWFLSHIAADDAPEGSREAFWELRAAGIPPGAEGLFVVPYWNGQLTPLWDHTARGLMLGFGAAHTSAHIYRAILEGIAFELRWCVEEAQPDFSMPLEELVAMGGGARSPLWCQLFADILDCPVVLARNDEATSLGAGILAAVGAGMHASIGDAVAAMVSTGRRFEPDPVAVARYDSLYRVYRQVYPAVQPLYPLMDQVRRG